MKGRLSEKRMFGLRVPDDMRDWLEVTARKNRRSVTAEILSAIDKVMEENREQQQNAAPQNEKTPGCNQGF